jgi:hypothetical protein
VEEGEGRGDGGGEDSVATLTRMERGSGRDSSKRKQVRRLYAQEDWVRRRVAGSLATA